MNMASNLQILLVDDDRHSNFENCKIIQENKIANCVKVALNGGHALLYLDQAFSNLKNNKLLILLDTQMPIMNGFEFIKHFQRFHGHLHSNIEIALMTNHKTTSLEIERAKDLGIVNFLQKPLNPSDIFRILNRSEKLEKVA